MEELVVQMPGMAEEFLMKRESLRFISRQRRIQLQIPVQVVQVVSLLGVKVALISM